MEGRREREGGREGGREGSVKGPTTCTTVKMQP